MSFRYFARKASSGEECSVVRVVTCIELFTGSQDSDSFLLTTALSITAAGSNAQFCSRVIPH